MMKRSTPLSLLASLALCAACGEAPPDDGGLLSDEEMFFDGDEKADGVTPPVPAGGTGKARGNLWDYDPGPPVGSRWAELFAKTPNYRALGIRVLGGKAIYDEKFRWEFGPMYYRGRLTPGSVKVFVVGQEGAQDESASNRTFTGSTGTKMQNFLKTIGINRSYLFMNTFTYTIHGQYTEMDGTTTPQVKWLAQSPESPIVQHRHSMFNYMREQNQDALNLVIGVGVAGRDSVVTWVQSRWDAQTPGSGVKKCPSITRCDATVLGAKVKVLGLPHPGAASARNGGDDAFTSLSQQFTRAVAVVKGWAGTSGWLPADPGVTSRFTGYRYTNYPTPFGDYAFGTIDVLGSWGTTSNRRDNGQAIQVFSDDGCYNNYAKDAMGKCFDPMAMDARVLPLSYRNLPDLSTRIGELPAGDLAWEFPRQKAAEFDAGPPADLAKLLRGGELPFPDFAALGVTEHKTLGATWFYRGRLDGAKLLVLADQESHDDMFSGRALSGSGGQRLQALLSLVPNLGKDYAILRSLPVDTLDLSAAQALSVATDAKVLALVKEALTRLAQRGAPQAILAVGPLAREQLARIGSINNIKVINLDFPDDAKKHVVSWQDGLRALGAAKPTDYSGQLLNLPRLDLPVHSRWWMGTSGSRGDRGLNKDTGKLDPNYYKVTMPDWVARLYPAALSAEEEAAVQKAPPLP